MSIFIAAALAIHLTNKLKMASAVSGPSTKQVHPFYCAVCSLPTEYCEFGPSVSKCKAWLEGQDKDEYERVWGEGEPASNFLMGHSGIVG